MHAIRIILSKSGSARPLMQLIQKNNTPPLDCEVIMYSTAHTCIVCIVYIYVWMDNMTKHNMRVRIKSRLQQWKYQLTRDAVTHNFIFFLFHFEKSVINRYDTSR